MFFSQKSWCIYFAGILFLFSAIACTISAGQDIRFSDTWKFYRGTPAGTPSATVFTDAAWQTVYLPHTDSVILNYNSSSYYIGYSWYRKSFSASAYLGKKVFIEFEAAMQAALVYLNGTLITTHLGGYSPFVLDITDNLRFDTANILAVQLNNTYSTNFPPGHSDPDFLYFGGLYRNVHLLITDSLHITNALFAKIAGGGGIFVTYPNTSTVQVATHVLNEYKSTKSCIVTTTLIDSNGNTVTTNSTSATNLAAGAANTFTQSLAVSNPHLWHPNTPYLYKVKSQVYSGTILLDSCTTIIGIRTISFTKAGGLQINGTRFFGRGADRHQAYPYIGNAVPNSGQYRDALRMKQYGFNFVRMSHYTQPESFVDACDKLGIVGMACEPGWQYFNNTTTFINNSISALQDMIRYYRNHPSVIIYEAAHNETYGATGTGTYGPQAQTAAHAEYPGSQMFTAGEETNGDGTTNMYYDVYLSSAQHGARSYSGTRPCLISEYGDWEHGCVWANPITGCVDRVDRGDGEASMLTQLGNHMSDLSLNRGLSWLTCDGLWTAFDYQSWSNGPLTKSGSLDIFRIPKFSAYFFKSQRSPGDTLIPAVKGGPMVSIANYWMASSPTTVTVFSNCDSVALYLNNTLVAKQGPITGTNLEQPKFSFATTFTSGTLRANGLIGGVVNASDTVTTPGTATHIVVTIDTADLTFAADGSDIAIVYAALTDANGTIVPTTTNSVTFSLSGSADFVGNNPQPAEAGIASILLRSRTTGSRIIVTAAVSGLTSGSDTVTSVVPSSATGIIERYSSVNARSKTPACEILQKGSILYIHVPAAANKELAATKFTLHDILGRVVGQWNVTKNNLLVNMKSFPHGVYFGQINDGADKVVQKVMW